MALNPQLNPNTDYPIANDNEHFILQETDIEFMIIINTLGKLEGIGKCILTT